MHFHLPKPLHGWREFVGEVGVIVLGVLIALGAEQIVESFHWRSETQRAREAIYSDAQDNLSSIRFRQEQQGCVDRRLQEIRSILHFGVIGQPLRLLGPVGRPAYSGAPQTAWQISVASDALAHMSLQEKLDLGGAFSNYANFDQIQRTEQDAWLKLGALDDPDLLSDQEWAGLHEAYTQAREINERLKIVVPFVLALNRRERVPTMTLPHDVKVAVRRFCSPILPPQSSRM